MPGVVELAAENFAREPPSVTDIESEPRSSPLSSESMERLVPLGRILELRPEKEEPVLDEKLPGKEDQPNEENPTRIPHSSELESGEDNSPGNHPLAKLYFRHDLPYEYEVVKHSELHPRLREEVDYIRGLTRASRYGLIENLFHTVASLNIFALAARGALHMVDMVAGIGRIFSVYTNLPPSLRTTDPTKRIFSLVFQSLLARHAPYFGPSLATTKLSTLIKSIADNEESPFARPDSSYLLQNFNKGIIDNDGNIVLMKHPLADTSPFIEGLKKLGKLIAWFQPFQRTRFSLSKPTFREKVRQRSEILGALPAGNSG